MIDLSGGQRTMRRLFLGLILALLGPLALRGQSVKPADLDGEWVVALERYGETDYRRMTLRAVADRVTGLFGRLECEGVIREGKIELHRAGEHGPTMSLTGAVDRNGMAGDFSIRTMKGKWKATRIPVRPPTASRVHVFEPKEFHRVFSGAIPPVLHIFPGDTVKTWSVDAGGVDAMGVERSLGGNPLTGPFYIEGALPGDTLVVKLARIRLNRDTAISTGRIVVSAITPQYALARSRQPAKNDNSEWVLNREKGVARLAKPTPALENYTVPLRPFLGCVGVAPPDRMVFRTGYPGSFGGNMDYNRLREGVTLYLPVSQPGALLLVRDGHAAQGDGELTGDALETSMDIEFAVDVMRGKSSEMPRAEDDECLMAMGIAGTLNEGLQIATTELARWLEDSYTLNTPDVASVLGTAMRYDIAEVVDPYVNVVARVPKRLLARIQQTGR
jgi:acetamidase/formamidase